jgi:hypothetical protein
MGYGLRPERTTPVDLRFHLRGENDGEAWKPKKRVTQ